MKKSKIIAVVIISLLIIGLTIYGFSINKPITGSNIIYIKHTQKMIRVFEEIIE